MVIGEQEQAGGTPASSHPRRRERLESALRRARSSVGERSLHTREVAGSKPAVPMGKACKIAIFVGFYSGLGG